VQEGLVAERLRVGLAGCGRWGRHILRDLLSLGCEVDVATTSEASRRQAAEGGAARVFGSVGELPEADGFVVATPTSTHAEVVGSLLGRGRPVFCEKPLTHERESAARLAQLGAGRLFVMDKWRYHPGVRMLAEIARGGELGPVVGLRSTRAQWGNPHPDVDATWILTPHDLSIALEVLGHIPEPRAAVAERAGVEVTGLYGLLGAEPWLVVEVSARHPEFRREVRLHCRDGVAVLEDGSSENVRVTRWRGGASTEGPATELRPVPQEMPLLSELRAFVEHLRGGPPPRSSAAEGAANVATIAELRRLAGLA
jgi:predicted dehydrogenase